MKYFNGLRHVSVHATLGINFPPPTNSEADTALVRAANCALQRKASGFDDVFLFVVIGKQTIEVVTGAVSAYGFPNADVELIETEDVERRLEMGEELGAEIGVAVERWIDRNHPAAIAFRSADYSSQHFWWSGIEHLGSTLNWPFDYAAFSRTLPMAYRSRAATLLAVLGHAVMLDESQISSPLSLEGAEASLWAATLCEWLHGFEAASGNGFNQFEMEYPPSLIPPDLYLGFEMGRLSASTFAELSDSSGEDIDAIRMAVLKMITANRRTELREALSVFFGGDSGLLWALHSAIWPSYADSYPRPMSEAIEVLLNTDTPENQGEIEPSWRFVCEGWVDEADD